MSWRHLLGYGSSLLLLVTLGGCAGHVMPTSGLDHPDTVYLVDHGRHASVVLPDGDGVVRYSYGEWNWYVLGQRGVWAGLSALAWPTQGGLGRKRLDETDHPPLPEALTPEGRQVVYALPAETARVDALRKRLDAYFEAPSASPTYSTTHGLYFVPYPRDYWAGHQSNMKVVEWLRELGMEVNGSAWLSRWRIKTRF